MTDRLAPTHVLYRAAAGPRIGFGHLVRCRSLARAMGEHPITSIRGDAPTKRTAATLGWAVVNGGCRSALETMCPDALVVDDPSPRSAASWVRTAQAMGVPVATIHDLGMAYVSSDLSIDGTFQPGVGRNGRFGDLRGTGFAILDPAVVVASSSPRPDRVLIALGGGEHARQFAGSLAAAIASRAPQADIRVAAGFVAAADHPRLPKGRWFFAPDGLSHALADATVVVSAGGVTMYEACAIGRATVGIALTPEQDIALSAAARHGAVIHAGAVGAAGTATHVADHVARLIDSASARASLVQAGRRLVDGRGAFRVADWLRELVAFRRGLNHAA